MIITGFSSNDGQVTVAPSDSRENYEARKGGQEPLRGCAVKLFHDENSNGDLDTNFPGIPNEPYASSNNALGSFGPPDYEEALFSFNPEQLSIYILVE